MQGLDDKYQGLKDNLRQYNSAIVAFSGGIDSSLVAYVAGEILGKKALAVTSASASLKRADLELAEKLAIDWGISHKVIVTDELSKPEYRQNPSNRCFHCKTSLYTYLDEMAKSEAVEIVLNGTNLDDLGDHRPGLIAAENFEVRSPLVESGFHKQDIRALAHKLGLENADKPQAACLSSRFPYGTHITLELLGQVEAAEAVLEDLGFSEYRVRHHNEVARLEIGPQQFALALEKCGELQRRIQATGYHYVALDLAGFRSGSLNETLTAQQKTQKIAVVHVHTP
ncbi:MAG: ATP-dependent sacrificial sulfur transferase LarE [Gammaproteobacteria bacterium]|nr:ATP-dependent sacrificial sulfur transferase LarE [Gammaproteobacteria bacterium]